jgi:polar amino acid transport system substrate-binding protein
MLGGNSRGVVVLLAVLTLAACSSGPRAAAPRGTGRSALRVAIPADAPPYGFRREGALVGLEVDFARELATSLGRSLDVLPVAWPELIPTLLAGRTDLAMAGLTITPAREVRMAFSEPYLRSGLLALLRREDAGRYQTVRNVMNATPIGVVSGTTAERFVRERGGLAAALVYPTALAAVTELRQHRVELVVHDAPVVIWFASGDESNLMPLLKPLNEEQLGWAMRRDDDELRGAVNAALARWRSDGTRERILSRWIPYWQRLESAEAPK